MRCFDGVSSTNATAFLAALVMAFQLLFHARPLGLCAVLIALSWAPASGQVLLHELTSPDPYRGAEFGTSVAGVPDVDGDGRGDLLVGEPGEYRAHLFSGATGALFRTLHDPLGEGDYGQTVSGVPDANGDGVGDLLVGAPAYWDGLVHLHSGATGAYLRSVESPSTLCCGGDFGSAIAGVGDVDGDGRGDILVGAPTEYGAGWIYYAGNAYLYSGATGALLRTFRAPTPREDDYFGNHVAGVPDIDGDGVMDLAIASASIFPSLTYLYSGATGALLRTLPSTGSVAGIPDTDGDGRGDVLIRGSLYSGATGALLHTLAPPPGAVNFGSNTAGLPDVDGDGRGDLLVGAAAEFTSQGSGAAYVYSGATGVLLFELQSPYAQPADAFGYSVSGVPNANGRWDFLVGAPQEDMGTTSWTDEGRAYLFSSPAPAGGYALTATASPAVLTYGEELLITITVSNDTDDDLYADLWLVTSRDGAPGSYVEYIGARTVPAHATATREIVHSIPYAHDGYAIVPGNYTVVVNGGEFATSTVLASDSYNVTIMAAGPAVGGASGGEAPSALSSVATAPTAVSPNPLSDRATLSFALDTPSEVRVALYDVLGREVAAVAAGTLEAGPHRLGLDLSALPTGAYVWRLTAGDRVEAGRLTVAR